MTVQGIVKFYKKENGWGFCSYQNKDYFVHAENILDESKILYRNEPVEFTIVETSKGSMAVDVKKLSSAKILDV